jgi:hypothetical protein
MKQENKYTGYWSGEKCPECNCELLINSIGDIWCSFIECDYRTTILLWNKTGYN